jgi:hypothetical protein
MTGLVCRDIVTLSSLHAQIVFLFSKFRLTNSPLTWGFAMTHKNRSRWRVILVIAVSIGFWLSSENRTSRAQVCGRERGCYTDFFNTCIPAPTSFKAVNVHAAGDWHVEDVNGHCGAKKFLFVFAKPCGPPLSFRLCTSTEKQTL